MQNFQISVGGYIKSNQMSTSTLNDVITTIKTDSSIATKVTEIRSSSTKEGKSRLKKELPYFNLGTFQDNKRLTQNFNSSEFMIGDIDNLDKQQLDEIKNKLQNDSRVYIYFVSPSGNGYKIVYRFSEQITDSKKFSENYKYYAQQMSEEYGVELDKTSDSARACFFSHDPDLYLNKNAECLEVKEFVETVDKLDFTQVDISKKENKIKKDDETFLPDVVKFLSQKIDNDDDWYKCGMALASLGERGRSYFQELSRNPKYSDDTPEFIDKKFTYLLKEKRGAVNLPTLFTIAFKEYDYKYPENIQPKTIQVSAEPFHETLLKRFEFDDNRDPKEPMGYRLSQFSTIMTELDGLQMGYYHLGADSNVGKTAFMHNLALDLINSNDDLQVLFFSQDDPKLYASYRLIALMGGLDIQDSKKGMATIKNDSIRSAQLKEAREKYIDLLKTERLILKDTADLFQLDQLEEVVSAYYQKSKKILVIIDGLYNLEVNSSKEGIRIENIERAKRIKRIVDTYQIPLITTGELRKKQAGDKSKTPKQDDLMESGKFAYNANIVWLLYAADATMANATEVKINLDYAKNKISGYKGIQKLTFVRSEGKMYESWDSFDILTEEEEV